MEAEIRRLREFPRHIDTVVRWLREEWRAPESTLAKLLDPPDCPPTLLAVSGGTPIGVLGFARFQRKGERHRSLFIDAVYTAPAFRGRGVGTALLDAAVAAAGAFERELFVHTDKRQWYEKRGWSMVESEAAPPLCVLVRRLVDAT